MEQHLKKTITFQELGLRFVEYDMQDESTIILLPNICQAWTLSIVWQKVLHFQNP